MMLRRKFVRTQRGHQLKNLRWISILKCKQENRSKCKCTSNYPICKSENSCEKLHSSLVPVNFRLRFAPYIQVIIRFLFEIFFPEKIYKKFTFCKEPSFSKVAKASNSEVLSTQQRFYSMMTALNSNSYSWDSLDWVVSLISVFLGNVQGRLNSGQLIHFTVNINKARLVFLWQSDH